MSVSKKTETLKRVTRWKRSIAVLATVSAFFVACGEETPEPAPSGLATQTAGISASPSPSPTPPFRMDVSTPDYREAMRRWVIAISETTRETHPDFIIIPQNASPLLTGNGTPDGKPVQAFITAIDGLGQESLSYGEGGYGVARGEKSKTALTEQLKLAKTFSLSVLSIDYCGRTNQIAFAEDYNAENGFIGFSAPNIELTETPPLVEARKNTRDIKKLSDAENFLIVLNPEKYSAKSKFLAALSATDYDVLIIDTDFSEHEAYTYADIEGLKTKAGGGRRLVIAYLSIGEAEDYRAYWRDSWHENPPEWLLEENRAWDGNYVVKYWNAEWQDIILYREDSVAKRILDVGFDGVYLDIVDGYEYFEDIAGY